MRRFRLWGMGLAALLVLGTLCQAQDSVNVQSVGEYAYWNWTHGLDASGDYLYVAADWNGLRILDISDPTQPLEVGYCGNAYYMCEPQFVKDVVVAGNYAYVGTYLGMTAYDISDPSQPSEMDSLWLDIINADVVDIAVWDTIVFLADYCRGIYLVDVSDPAALQQVGFFELSQFGYIEAMAVRWPHVYLTGWDAPGGGFLRSVLVSDPAQPIQLDYLPLTLYPTGLDIEGNIAYVAGDHICAIDISDPGALFSLGDLALPHNWPGSVEVVQNRAYVAARDTLDVIDVTYPSAMTLLAWYPFPTSGEDIISFDNPATLAATGSGILLLDISDPHNPIQLSQYGTPGEALNSHVSGGCAYVACTYGLQILSLEDPAQPRQVAYFDSVSEPHDVYVQTSYAYIADGLAGLRILNVSDPAAPVQVALFDTPGSAKGIQVIGDYAYVGDYGGGLRILDVSQPSNPEEVGFYDVGSSPLYDLDVVNNRAYLTYSYEGLRIVDVSNPANPVEVGAYDTPGYAYGIKVSGGRAYIADGDSLRILDVNNPTAPFEMGRLKLDPCVSDVDVSGSYAFLTGGWGHPGGFNWFWVVDVGNPSNPHLIAYDELDSDVFGVTALGTFAYVADGSYFNIYDCGSLMSVEPEPATALPAAFVLYPGHPNPFNSTAAISYLLPADSRVSLKVYNPAGRIVMTMVDGWKPAGTHQILFDGSGLPSGIYLARLTAGDFQQTQKLALMK